MTARKSLNGVEFLRFISSVSIVLWHYKHFFYIDGRIDYVHSELPFYSALKLFYEYGEYSVKLFWCISGFIIFYKYYFALKSRVVSGWEFSVYRFARLYPLHLMTLFLVAALQQIYRSETGRYFVFQHNDVYHFALNFLMISGWGYASGFSFNAPIWSVSVELAIYALFFFGARRLSLTGCVAAGIGLAAVFSKVGQHEFAHCLTYFLTGGVLALYQFYSEKMLPKLISGNLAFHGLGVLAFALAGFAFKESEHYFLMGHGQFVFEVAAAAALVYGFVAGERLFLRYGRLWLTLGNLTYASYLLNFPVQLAIVAGASALGTELNGESKLLFTFYILTTYGVAFLVYQGFEVPTRAWLRRALTS